MSRFRRGWAAAALVLLVVAAGCGDDDDAGTSDTGAPSSSQATTDDSGATGESTPAGTPDEEAQAGGSAEILVWNEVRSLSPFTSTAAAGSTAQRDFALYGALVGYDAEVGDTEPIFAESVTPNETFDVWTFVIRDGITFSDGTPYDAEAVKVNWETHQNPDTASPARGVAASITEMVVVDPLTLEVHLAAPNSVFPGSVSRNALNYIASPTAIQAGADIGNDPVGAGPFVVGEWVRDSHIRLVRNPAYWDAPRPYLDELTFRVVTDEEQRIGTFSVGDADAMWTTTRGTVNRVTDEVEGAVYNHVELTNGSVVNFNTSTAPFDDVRMRQAFARAIDWQVMIEVVDGDDAETATNLTLESQPWYTEGAALPEHDTEAAQALIDEYIADNGGPVSFSIIGTQQNRNVVFNEFMQTSLNQLDGLEVTVEQVDSPTLTQRALSGDFQASLWGYPTAYPDPDMFQGIRTGLTTNMTRYENDVVNDALDAARTTADLDERADLYRTVYEELAQELPFRPTGHPPNGFVTAEQLHGMAFYQDGVIRSDLLWIDQG